MPKFKAAMSRAHRLKNSAILQKVGAARSQPTNKHPSLHRLPQDKATCPQSAAHTLHPPPPNLKFALHFQRLSSNSHWSWWGSVWSPRLQALQHPNDSLCAKCWATGRLPRRHPSLHTCLLPPAFLLEGAALTYEFHVTHPLTRAFSQYPLCAY